MGASGGLMGLLGLILVLGRVQGRTSRWAWPTPCASGCSSAW